MSSSWVGPSANSRSWRSREAHELGAVVVPAARLLPDLGRLHDRHQHLLAADRVHLLAHDLLDLADASASRAAGTCRRPPPTLRTMPARSRMRCEAMSASDGSSFSVGAYSALMRSATVMRAPLLARRAAMLSRKDTRSRSRRSAAHSSLLDPLEPLDERRAPRGRGPRSRRRRGRGRARVRDVQRARTRASARGASAATRPRAR